MSWNIKIIITRNDSVGKPPIEVSVISVDPDPTIKPLRLAEEVLTEAEFKTFVVPLLLKADGDDAITSVVKQFTNIRSLEGMKLAAELQAKDLGVKLAEAFTQLGSI